MDEIRLAARAYHKKSSKEEKEFAESLFKKLDVELNGQIKFKVFHDKFEKEQEYMKRAKIFKKLHKTDADFLDKEDIITLSYIIKSGRLLFCDTCSEFLTGQYFLCLQCYESSTNESFYKLCSSCYDLSVHLHVHEGAKFIDNDSLAKRLREKRREAAKSGKSNIKDKNDQAEKPGKSNMENKNHPWQDPQILLVHVLITSIGGWIGRELTLGTDSIISHCHVSASNIHDATSGANDHHDIASSSAGNTDDHNIESDHSDMIQSGADNIHDHNIGCDHSDMIQSGDTINHLHDHFSYNYHDVVQSAADAAHAHADAANSMADVASSAFDHISSLSDHFSWF